MISVADLFTDDRIPGNYFATDTYLKSDLELGIIENRAGSRLLALPAPLIEAIYSGLEKETGQATSLVLSNCGRWWGRNFYKRFCAELGDYYSTAVSDMPMVEFLQALEECWRVHGWGRIEIDQSYHGKGFLLVYITNSPFAALANVKGKNVCALEAGVLTSFFCEITGKDITCIELACECAGAERNCFVVGLSKRLQGVDLMLEQHQTPTEILENLTA